MRVAINSVWERPGDVGTEHCDVRSHCPPSGTVRARLPSPQAARRPLKRSVSARRSRLHVAEANGSSGRRSSAVQRTVAHRRLPSHGRIATRQRGPPG